ncbi:hypothetical protein QBC39DRAFT_59861 [Podospora conica]|nr:hypothetical protein QBC39DRAFT_59861 [Schizothecium conicum]
MANRRLLLLCLSLSAPVCPALASPENETAPAPKTTFDLAAYPRMGSRHNFGLSPKARPSLDNEQRPMGVPLATPSVPLEMKTKTGSSPCSITAAPGPEQVQARQVNNPVVTIIFLSSALASATSNMVVMSQQMSSSIIQLQSSLRSVASSASSAILSVQTSAAQELAAAEASAAEAIASVEESAASRVNEIMSRAGVPTAYLTGVPPQKNTYQVVRNQETSISVTMVAVAIVASVVGSTFFSILGFYLFVFRRRKRQQKEHEAKCKEDELDVNAALDRAIVSYIAKESPGMMSPGTQKMGQAMMMDDMVASGPPPTPFLTVPPAYRGHRPRPSLPSNGSPRMVSAATMPGHTRHGSIPPQISDLSGFVSPPGRVPPGPPPTIPLPEIPPTPRTPRTPRLPAKTFKRTPSRTSPDSAERIYAQILTQPLQPTPTVSPTTPTPPLEDGPAEAKREGESKNDANWPLGGNGWL